MPLNTCNISHAALAMLHRANVEACGRYEVNLGLQDDCVQQDVETTLAAQCA